MRSTAQHGIIYEVFADFSPELKRAFVLPLLKKAVLDYEILKNFRPVSNLSFLSKLVERIVCVQFVDHLKAHHLYEVFQSAYRQLHSTETALLRVQNDLLRAVDTHGGAILVLLDLSAVFDTIDHQRLLHTLESSFGIKGKVLDWFQSYLTGRTQTVQIKKSTSEPHELKYGVPQGSVLGPILFTIYTTPLGQLIRRHSLTFHLYADDTQLYLAFKPSEPSSIVNNISRLEKCVDDIRAWMKLNLLKLNDDKTELLVITSRPSTSQSLHISIKVGDQDISPSEEPPKNLGVIFDSTCSLKDHVSNVCRSINFNLYSIGKIRKYLDRPTVEKLVNATITSRLDYCNSLMFGIPKELISQLQKRQNHAARVITKWRKYDHITPVLVGLHWLPVKQRIDFKILLLTYKALNRHQTILHTFSQLFLNLTLSGVPHLYIQLPNGQYLSDLCKMCNLEANQRKMWTGDHRILTYIFKWERLNTAGHSHTVSIGHSVVPLYND